MKLCCPLRSVWLFCLFIHENKKFKDIEMFFPPHSESMAVHQVKQAAVKQAEKLRMCAIEGGGLLAD